MRGRFRSMEFFKSSLTAQRVTQVLRNKIRGLNGWKSAISCCINHLAKNSLFAQHQNNPLTIPKLSLKFCFNDSTDRY